MGFKPRTSAELNQFHIEKTLKKLERNEIRVQECDLNKRFERLKIDSEPWYDELHAKYVDIVRKKSMAY
tara:strand:- start:19843 stop:20049 length:207 start_codon:yes stop_codon:yes gene_type:complete